MSDLYNSINYQAPIKYIFSRYIREYDISKANINILYRKGVIDSNTFSRLLGSSRDERQIEIGLMEKHDNNIYKVLSEGIIEAKKWLFESNNLEDRDILAIRNDAVFVIDKQLAHTSFDNINFMNKNTYTSFICVGKNPISVFYRSDKISGQEFIDTKGLGKKSSLHDSYMTDFIIYIINQMEQGDPSTAISILTDVYKQYVSLNMDIGYYREYNSDSSYKILNSEYRILDAYDKDKYSIDISYNMNILRELYSYIAAIYLSNK